MVGSISLHADSTMALQSQICHGAFYPRLSMAHQARHFIALNAMKKVT
jgi:hypothetical protein